MQKFPAALYYLVHGTSYSVLEDAMQIDRNALNKFVPIMVEKIAALEKNIITFPKSKKSTRRLKTGFYQLSGIPRCLGAMDGTFIPITANICVDENGGKMDPVSLYSRKNRYSLNVLTICDSNGVFLFVDPGNAATQHDSTIFKGTEIYKKLESGKWGFGAAIAVDSAYGKSNFFLQKKYGNPAILPKQVNNYNSRKTTAR